MKYSILIPVYNENSTIYSLISELENLFSVPIIVVDDGSEKVLKNQSNLKNLHILRNEKNTGKGHSILKGLKYSSSLNCTHTITIDGDGQHNPKNIQRFIDLGETYDLILGARQIKKPMPFHRRLSNRITSFLISKVSGFKIHDSQSGFRMYRNAILENINFNEKRFQFESEIFFKIKKSTNIKEVPIDLIYNDKKSHINNTIDTLRFVRLIFREIFYGK